MTQNLINFSQTLQKLDEINRGTVGDEKVNPNSFLLLTLSTAVMVAKKQPVEKEYYQWTRLYLQNISDNEGKKLPNTAAFLNHLNKFERENNIEDELIDEELADDLGVSMIPGVVVQVPSDDDDDFEADFAGNLQNRASSTQNPINQADLQPDNRQQPGSNVNFSTLTVPGAPQTPSRESQDVFQAATLA